MLILLSQEMRPTRRYICIEAYGKVLSHPFRVQFLALAASAPISPAEASKAIDGANHTHGAGVVLRALLFTYHRGADVRRAGTRSWM
jgi:hypothetical protein